MQSPALCGRPVRIEFLSGLTVSRGKLLSGESKGQEVHAGSFLRERRIVLDTALLENWDELNRILVHELFHFAWVRLSNEKRWSWERLLRDEFTSRAPGELGWSAEWRKAKLGPSDARRRTSRWRRYACESFCDTAAWLFAGLRTHDEFTLPARARQPRRTWFRKHLGDSARNIGRPVRI